MQLQYHDEGEYLHYQQKHHAVQDLSLSALRIKSVEYPSYILRSHPYRVQESSRASGRHSEYLRVHRDGFLGLKSYPTRL